MNHSDNLIVPQWKKIFDLYTKPGDIELVRLSLKNNPTQNDLNNLLDIWDIEVKGGSKSLLLSYIQKIHPKLCFDETVLPRIKGLLSFYRYNNIRLAAEYRNIVRTLNKNNIVPLIFKGGAIRHLRPALPRNMGDIDIVVRNEDFDKTTAIISDLGFTCMDSGHSVDWHKSGNPLGLLDVHRYIPLRVSGTDKSGTIAEQNYLNVLFSRAKEENVFGTRTLIPTHEDILFINIINLARNILNSTSLPNLIFSIYDCHFLQRDKPDFNWEIVFNNIENSKVHPEFGFAIHFMRNIAPETFSDSFYSTLSSNPQFFDFLPMLYYQQKRAFRKKRKWKNYLSAKLIHSIAKLAKKPKLLETYLLKHYELMPIE